MRSTSHPSRSAKRLAPVDGVIWSRLGRRPIGSVRTTGRLPGRVFPLIIVYVAYHLGLASGPQFINANNIGVPECKSAPRDRDPELVNDPLSVDRCRSPLIAGIRGRFAGQFVGKNRS